jgi:hypothetical protein
MDELVKRCGLICGDDRTGCFVENANHLECITDIIINKVWAARAIIELGARESSCERMAGILNVATGEMDELVDWMKNLRSQQIDHASKGRD